MPFIEDAIKYFLNLASATPFIKGVIKICIAKFNRGINNNGNPQPAGRIFEIKRFAVHDGPGIRTTVFFKGCPLRCVWCHNPEGISNEPEIAFLEGKCVKCGECFSACPRGLHETGRDGAHRFQRKGCTACLSCVSACMPGALKPYGTETNVRDLLDIVRADTDFYYRSGGGVTCSGGEPLTQPDFLAAFLSGCKEAGLHTAVDTSGFAPWEAFQRILPFTDLFLYDVKHMDPLAHRKLTGQDNRLILGNLRELSARGAAIEIRMPVIPGLNDDERTIRQTAAFLKNIKTLTRIRVLP